MWMLANRLEMLSPELHSSENTPRVLKSARLAYATDCVYVYAEGNAVVVRAEEDYFVIRELSLKDVYATVQSVFDSFENWCAQLEELAQEGNFQKMTEMGSVLLNNPLAFLDQAYRVLGISKSSSEEDLGDEWNYMKKYGFASVDGPFTRDAQLVNGRSFFTLSGARFYHGVSVPVSFQNEEKGNLCIIVKDRILNCGDFQILDILSRAFGRMLFSGTIQKDYSFSSSVFEDLLCGERMDTELLKTQLELRNWGEEDVYQLYLLEFFSSSARRWQLRLVFRTICGCLKEAQAVILGSQIAVLYNCSRGKLDHPGRKLRSIAEQNHMTGSCSLSLEGIWVCPYLMSQAAYVLNHMGQEEQPRFFAPFVDCALDYVLESQNLEECVYAVHPKIRSLYQMEEKERSVMLDTLRAYLRNDTSLVNTARELFIHRNTLVYRMAKINEYLHESLEDRGTLAYLRLSIRVMDLYKKRV